MLFPFTNLIILEILINKIVHVERLSRLDSENSASSWWESFLKMYELSTLENLKMHETEGANQTSRGVVSPPAWFTYWITVLSSVSEKALYYCEVEFFLIYFLHMTKFNQYDIKFSFRSSFCKPEFHDEMNFLGE